MWIITVLWWMCVILEVLLSGKLFVPKGRLADNRPYLEQSLLWLGFNGCEWPHVAFGKLAVISMWAHHQPGDNGGPGKSVRFEDWEVRLRAWLLCLFFASFSMFVFCSGILDIILKKNTDTNGFELVVFHSNQPGLSDIGLRLNTLALLDADRTFGKVNWTYTHHSG